MASTWSALKIELLETGANSGTWGTATNVNLGDAVLGEVITGSATVDFPSAADVTITLTDSATTQSARNLRLNITESGAGVGYVGNLILGSGCQIEKFYLVRNNGTGVKTIKNTTGTGVAVAAGKATLVYNDGTNVVDVLNSFSSAILGAENAGSIIPFYFANQAAFPSASTYHGAIAHSHADGAMYFAHSSAWVRMLDTGGPLGTPSSGTATNLTGLPLTTGVTGTLPTANGGTNLTSFTSGGVVFASSASVLATGSALVFDGTNLGLGVTPQTWFSTAKALQIGNGISLWSSSNAIANLSQNLYLDATATYRWITANPATNFIQDTGAFKWQLAAGTPTAGGAIGSFSTYMTLDASGNLGLAETSPSAYGGFVTKYAGIGLHANSTSGASGLNLYEGGAGRFSLRTLNGSAGLSFYDSFNATERARIDSAGTFSIKNDYQEQTFTGNSSTAITLNIVTNGTDQVITLTGTATITMPTATAGKSFLLKLKTGAGGYTVTWSTVKWPSGTAPTLTSTASRMDIFSFFSDGTNWYGTTVGQNYTP